MPSSSEFLQLPEPIVDDCVVPKGIDIAATFGNVLTLARRYAVLRAALTLFHELHTWDDSYGVMGELGTQWIKEVLQVTPTSIQILSDIKIRAVAGFQKYRADEASRILQGLNVSPPPTQIIKSNHLRLVVSEGSTL